MTAATSDTPDTMQKLCQMLAYTLVVRKQR